MSPSHPLLDQVRAAAAVRPGAAAVVHDSTARTYRELLADIDRLAGQLRAEGVEPGDTVALPARRDAHLPVSMLALWQAGATIALIDSTLPPAVIAAREAVVRPAWRLAGTTPVRLADDPRPRAAGGSHILFTSGSTGRPAAVEVGASALEGGLRWYRETFAPGASDRVGLLSGLGHDPVLRDILVPLVSGGTLLVPPDGVAARPSDLAGFLDSAGVTILHTTAAMLELLVAAGRPMPRLRLVVAGGAPLPAGLVRGLRPLTPAAVANAYGATETPQIVACSVVAGNTLPDPELPDETSMPVGSGVGGAELLVTGPAGEVVVCSPYLADGYLPGTGRPERFGDDPRGRPGYRSYRTGDRGEWGPDGLRIAGRIDREISVNGFRIAPEEVESAARRHPAVRQARAGRYAGPAGDLIELRVSVAGAEATSTRSLRAHLRAQLPGHAVPARIRIVPDPGLDANHKTTLMRSTDDD
ncbi:AMP-binding protein [Actinoplanes sp. NPDC049599]|uniref:AMP-binding protein n=1 Tax=Actinoplanes sp. NPDC049599 TaxID=3363903 RepID=UPI0037A6D626